MADTIAYSDKYGFWTSRYSFTPTCYASVDNHFFSCKEGENSGVYKHDVEGEDYNTFYEETFPSKMVVVSNENASTVKFFKSISLEANRSNFTAEVFTNEEYDGVEAQEGSFVGFESREGFQYAEMPRSIKNSSSNVFPMVSPILSGNDMISDSDIPNDLIEVIGVDQVRGFPIIADLSSNVPVSLNKDYRLYQVSEDGLLENLAAGYINNTVNEQVPQEGVEAYAHALEVVDGELYFIIRFVVDYNVGPEEVESLFLDALNLFNSQDEDNGLVSKQLVIVSPSDIDGDQMRGPYAKINLSIDGDDAKKPFEFHAVNVDYEFSRLDKGLTQNS